MPVNLVVFQPRVFLSRLTRSSVSTKWLVGMALMGALGSWASPAGWAQVIMPELPQVMVSIPINDVAKPLPSEPAPERSQPPSHAPSTAPPSDSLPPLPTQPVQSPASQDSKLAPAQAPLTPASSILPVSARGPAAHGGSVSSLLQLTQTQKGRLKAMRKNFVADNQAAFDSLRIKQYLIKQLKSPQEALQRSQLQAEIQQEVAVLKQKKEATLQFILNTEQYSKLKAHQLSLRAELVSQQAQAKLHAPAQPEDPKSAEKRASRHLSQEIKTIPRKWF